MGAFDDLIPQRQSGAFDDLIPAPKKKDEPSMALQVPAGMAESYAQGSGDLASGVGQFVQAPAANTLAGVSGAKALADRGISWLTKQAGGDGTLHTETQRTAQDTSDFAREERARNVVAGGILATTGRGLEDAGDSARQHWSQQIQQDAPELVRQAGDIQKADGFVDTTKAMLTNPLGTAGTVLQSMPAMVGGMGVGSATAKALGMAGKAVGASEQAIGKAMIHAGETSGIVTEGATSAMQTKQQVADFVLQQPFASLAQNSPRYAELVQSGKKPEEARAMLAEEIGNQGAVLAGTWTGAMNKATGAAAALGKTVVTGKASGKELIKGIGKESLEEGLQNPGENFMQYGAQVQVDPTQKYDFGGSVAQGLISGAAMAGPIQGAGYAQQKYDEHKQNQAAGGTPPVVDSLAPAPKAGEGGVTPTPAGAAPEPTAAERALAEPTSLTALDRVQEIHNEQQRSSERLAELNAPDSGYGPMFDQERQDLATRQQTLATEREALTKDWPKAEPGSPTSFTTEAGARLEAQYALMDVGDLVTSHDANLRQNPAYPKELQPRQRDRAASEMQVSGIVQKLDPARLGLSADAATGAPIVGADGLVESGNARTIALKRVYQANGQKAADYKQFLSDNAAQFGLSPEKIQAMDKPVLVRVRSTPVNRAEFARQANASTVAAMSPSEQAKSDANRIDSMEDLKPDESGDFQTSREFIRRFMARLPVTEQAGLVDASGALSSAGYARVRNAVLAKAYGDSPVLQRMVESMDDNLRNVSKALISAAPKVAQMREAMAQGRRFDADITPDLMAAVEELSRLKDSGTSIQDALAQAGMFGDKYSQETRDLLQFLADNLRRPKRMAEFITAYMEALDAAGDPNQGSLLGETQAPAKRDLMTAAKAQSEGGSNGHEPSHGPDQGAGQQGASQPANEAGGEGGAQGHEAAGQVGAANEPLGDHWVAFPKESGTLGIPRAEMPQVKGKDRGALINFLEARGITHESDRVAANSLKPTQAEYSRNKVDKFVETGAIGERSVMVSSDGHVLDGHHQWLGHAERGEEINVIRLDAPIKELLAVVNTFPGVKRSEGAKDSAALRAAAMQDFKDAMGDLALIATKHTRAAMIPEEAPGLMETLVKLFDAAIKIVGTDLKAATKYVRDQLRLDPATKKIANFIKNETMQKAARQALERQQAAPNDLFGQGVPKVAMINGKPYDMARDNFKPENISAYLPADVIEKADEYVSKYYKNKVDPVITPQDQQRGEELLKPLLKRAEDVKAAYDQKVIDIAQRTGALSQMIAPLKSMKRAVQKLVVEEKFDIGGMKDVLRSTIVVKSYADAQAVLTAIEQDFTLLRNPKNRTNEFPLVSRGKTLPPENQHAKDGYTDVMVNVVMPNGVIGEIQINIPSMLAAKEGQGHKLYEAYRDAPKDSPLGQEIMEAMRGFYEAAFDAASSSQAAADARKDFSSEGNKEAGRGSPLETKDLPSKEMPNTLPSGNLTRSSPPNESKNSQPGGNLSGINISSNLNESIADLPANGYTSGNLFGADDANVQPSAGGDQVQGTGTAQQPGRQGRVQSVRDGSGTGDIFSGGDADTSGSRAREVGQAGDDRVRGQDAGGGSVKSGNRAERYAGVPAGRDIPAKTGRNYEFGPDDLTYRGSWFKKAEQNVAAVELLQALEKEGRQATREEQTKLAQFVGWGSSEIANNLFGPKLDKAAKALEKYDEAIKALKEAGSDTLHPAQYATRHGGYGRGAYGSGYKAADEGYYEALEVMRSVYPQFQQDRDITRADLDKAKPDASTQRWVKLRDQLRAAMSEQELAEASRSTQYAHYTSKAVVQSMWKAMERMGFKGGAILEPGAGIGVFPGLMPGAMANNSVYTGIEFDSLTGRILKQLFPDERILVESFVDSKLPKNFYDVAIGNPPFSGTKILSDPEYAKNAFSLHDYFFAKSIDRVKPGGLVVYVTSRYTMDKLNDKARAYLADRADLVGAIRLPQTAFKQNAGTEVVTDVIFLRKKDPKAPFDGAQAWAKAESITINGNQYHINEYFAAHPDMVLGQHADTGSMYKDRDYTVTPLDGNIEEHFAKAVENLPADIYQAPRGSAAEAAKVREIDFNPKAKKEGNYYVSDAGVLMVREGGVGQRVERKTPKDMEIIKDFVPMRDALKQAHYDQLNDGEWEKSLKYLQTAYAKFTKKHGQVNQFTTRISKTKAVDEDTGESYIDETQVRVFPLLDKLRDDPDYTLVAALENINDDTGEIKVSNFLTERVLGKVEAPQISTPADALLATLNDVGQVDVPLIASRIGLSEADTIETLGSAIYQDPESGWQTADDYLSGNVKSKLAAAKEAARADQRYERNISALESVQPAPKTPSQISIGIGMNWVGGDVYSKFLEEKAGVKATVTWNEATRQWSVQEHSGGKTMKATADWGTEARNATALLEHALTGRPVRITETVGSGKDRKIAFNASATEAANQKLDALKAEFSTWIWTDPDRTDKLVRIYNDTFNTTVPRSFDGSHLALPGTSKSFHVFDHVKRGAWRIIQTGNTYLAHAVGSGKTFQMVIAAMEQKRLGLIKKPMVVVPNHMLQQFAHEWQQLYPAARLMVADENNFHTDNRRRFVSRVALSDLDGVVITHSAFKLLDLDPDFKAKIIEEQLEYLRAAMEQAEEEDDGSGGRKSPRIKQIEKQIENLEQKLEASMSSEGKDKNARFDELGVDFLMVDEAHVFRKLDYATARQVKGLSPEGSGAALDLYIKTRYLESKTPGRSLVMASGTPVTNTLAELYTVQRYMNRKALADRHIEDFDSWAAMFGRERTELEPNAAGKYEPVTRFSKFVNVPELTQMFREYADVLTADHLAALLGDKRPKVEGGSRTINITPKTRDYALYQKELEQRVADSRAWKPSKDEPNNPDPIIKIIGDGRLAAIDMRFIWPDAKSDPDSKLNKMLGAVIEEYKKTSDLTYNDKTGQAEPHKGAAIMVFSDLGFGAGVAASRGFNARAWFEKNLRDAGVNMSHVAFMSDYKKSVAKLKLFKDVNAGRVRILIGSSKNMGTGVNAQQRLKSMFHLDSPWYPSDLEQREGRIIRQGNKNPLVRINAFAAKGTYDENMWKMLASKQYFIDQALSGDANLREIEDLDSQSQYDLASAMVAEDPRIIQLAGAKAEIDKLHRLYQAHEDQRYRFKKQYDNARDTVTFNEKLLPAAEKLAGTMQDISGDNFKAKAMGKSYTERTEWGAALVEKFKGLLARAETQTQSIGEISGIKLAYMGEKVGDEGFYGRVVMELPEPVLLLSDPGASAIGVAMRAQNEVADVARMPARMRSRITEAKAEMDALASRLEAPFSMAGMLAEKRQEVAALEATLAAEGKQKDEAAKSETAPAPDEAVSVPVLSRGTAAAGMEARDLDAVVDRLSKGLKNLPKVHVFASPADLSTKIPEQKALRDYIKKHGAIDDVEGGFHNGAIYLFASGLVDEARAEHVLATHELTHYGLRGAMGRELDAALQHVWMNNANIRRAATALRGKYKLDSNVAAVEEVLADIPAGDLVKLKGWRRAVQAVRNWLNRIGATSLATRLEQWLHAGLDEQARADMFVADLVGAAREWVRSGKPAGKLIANATRLSSTLAEDVVRQEKWLALEAKARGYSDIEDLLARNYPLFEKLAKLWREKHPADGGVMLSRAPATAATVRADTIINTKAASRAPLDTLAKFVTRVTGIERLTGAIYQRAGYLLDKFTPEQIKAGLVADYGVPGAVIDQRAMMQGRQRVQLRKAGALIEKLSTLTRAESRVAYEWMNMDGADPKAYLSMMQGLPEESVQVLQDVQQMIDKLSREAVALGQLSQDAYDRNRFAYLRRSYAKHILEQTAGEKAKRARVISILGDQYKGRGLTDAAPMAKMQALAPEWWGRKLTQGKADVALKGEKFVRLERRAPAGAGVDPLPGMTTRPEGRLLETAYYPAGAAIPAKYADWERAGTWEVRDTKGQNVVLWRDFTKEERENMGEVDEARFAIAKTLHGMIHDVEVGRYLEWLGYTYAKKEGERIPGKVVEASESFRHTFAPDEWVRVPETKISGTQVAKYGKLAGRYLPGPVWNDLRQVVGGQFKPFGDTYAKILTLWKTSKTALSPAVHMNNVMSNFVMMDWHDVTAGHVSKALRLILAAKDPGRGMIGGAGNFAARAGHPDKAAAIEILNRYKDSGGDIGSWATNELAKGQLDPLLADLEKELAATGGASQQAQVGVMAALQHALFMRFPSAWEAFKGSKPGKVVGTEGKTLIELYQSEDDVFRLAAWLKAKEEGKGDLEAGKIARRSFMDYHINAPWIQAMRNSALPFISYTYRAVPMLLETAGKKPHKLLKLMALAGALNALGVMLSGGSDDERKLLPEEKAGRIWGLVPKLIRMPWNDANGSPVYLDVRRFIPVGDVLDVGSNHAAIPVLPALQPGGPLMMLGEILLNKQGFTGKPITLDTDTTMQQAGKVLDYLYKSFMPNLLGVPGTYATSGVVDAAKGKTDAFGRQQSVAQALASSVGVKVGSYPADVMRLNLSRAAQAQIAEINHNETLLKRQFSTHQISAKEYEAAIQAEQAKKVKVVEKLREKVGG